MTKVIKVLCFITFAFGVAVFSYAVGNNQARSLNPIECMSIFYGKTNEGDLIVEFHEKHDGKKCPGDPNVAPLIARFRTNKETGELEKYDIINDKYVTY